MYMVCYENSCFHGNGTESSENEKSTENRVFQNFLRNASLVFLSVTSVSHFSKSVMSVSQSVCHVSQSRQSVSHVSHFSQSCQSVSHVSHVSPNVHVSGTSSESVLSVSHVSSHVIQSRHDQPHQSSASGSHVSQFISIKFIAFIALYSFHVSLTGGSW